jgi:hypothetical protein
VDEEPGDDDDVVRRSVFPRRRRSEGGDSEGDEGALSLSKKRFATETFEAFSEAFAK